MQTPSLLIGTPQEITSSVSWIASRLAKDKTPVLIIDTLNSLNPHHQAFGGKEQESILKNIHCARAEKPYDLKKRIETSGAFIRSRKIKTLIITSLNLIFHGTQEDEALSVCKSILRRLITLNKQEGLNIMIGSSPGSDGTASMLDSYLQKAVKERL